MRNVVAVAVLLFSSLSAAAYDFSGNEVFVPIVARTPGANGTVWRTDLIVANRSEQLPTEVSMWFFPAPSADAIQHKFTLEPRQTITMKDILFEEFGIQQRSGTIWLGAKDESVKIAAHARIYNTGNSAGEFGQIIHALPIEQLSKVSWINGIVGVDGNRTNVGIANPNNTRALFSLAWYDKEGESHGSVSLALDPWEVMQINDIFTYLGRPPEEGMTLRVRSSNNVLYSYASVVRNDTGDAYTIIGSGSDD